jgi:hypothetical protein
LEIGHQTAAADKLPVGVDRWQPILGDEIHDLCAVGEQEAVREHH